MDAVVCRHLVFSPDVEPHWFCDSCGWASRPDKADATGLTRMQREFDAHDCAEHWAQNQ
jgi:hypothetical protein